MRILGLVVLLGLLGLGILNGGKMWMIIDISSVIMIVGLTLGISWQAGTPLKLVIWSFFSSNLTAEETKTAAMGHRCGRL
mgnify:CR=1 FL=1